MYRTRRVRIRWMRVAGLVVVIAAIIAALGHRLPGTASSREPSSWTKAPALHTPRTDHEVPAFANLDPDLRAAVGQAATDAADAGVVIEITSGWRSREHQQQLLDEAVAKYGSEAEAARWVATPDTSPHVSGDAVDIGPSDAIDWLSEHGPAYGLCRIYGNEPWHFELRPDAVVQGCPPTYDDPTHDPRMHQ
jgi:zinc D-Ala-D-Ala carboxypeptidase